MRVSYTRIVRHLGHPVQVEAHGATPTTERYAVVRCLRCDEIIVIAEEVTLNLYEVKHDG
jgi:hypothetical protein